MSSPTRAFPEGKTRGRTGPQGAAGANSNSAGPKGPSGARTTNSIYITGAQRVFEEAPNGEWYGYLFYFGRNDGSGFYVGAVKSWFNDTLIMDYDA